MDWHSRARKARQLSAQGRYAAALDIWRELVAETHSIEPQYDSWLRGLARCLVAGEQPTQAAYVQLYLQQFDDALALLGDNDPTLRAYVLEQSGQFRAAARSWEESGNRIAAAIAYERDAAAAADEDGEQATRSLEAARACYETLLRSGQVARLPYVEALLLFNLGQCCLALEDDAGHRHLVAAQRRLEEAADRFEIDGERERAFDCYQVLLECGRRSGAFENLAEGYINCVRILRRDNLRYYALQYYEDFLSEALEWKEYQAAASLYREVADYCRRSGMPYTRHYLQRAADTWQLAAQKTLKEHGAVEMAENALLAAVDCANAVDDFETVGALYRRLAALELGDRKQERYQRIATRYSDVASPRAEAPAVPQYLRQTRAYPQIWYADLLEWERAGDVEAVCASVVGDVEYPEVVRRRALNLLLLLREGIAETPEGLARIAEGLGDLQIYAVLSPLEHLLDRSDERVHCGVMRALRFLFFKRSFSALERGLSSASDAVQHAAIDALGRLHFNHAFDPLQRIYRRYEQEEVRLTALESIGRIPTVEAGDFLLQVLREEDGRLKAVAKRRLANFDDRDFLMQLRQQLDLESGALRDDLTDVLRSAGVDSYTP